MIFFFEFSGCTFHQKMFSPVLIPFYSQTQYPLRTQLRESPKLSFWFKKPISHPRIRHHDEEGVCSESLDWSLLESASPCKHPVVYLSLLITQGVLSIFASTGSGVASGREEDTLCRTLCWKCLSPDKGERRAMTYGAFYIGQRLHYLWELHGCTKDFLCWGRQVTAHFCSCHEASW